MSQAEFASIFNLARASIGAYEEGRSEPKIDTIIQIAEYFKLSIDTLLKRELTVNDLLGYGSFKAKLDKAHNKDLPSKVPPTSQKLVKIEKHLDYLVNCQNRDFVSQLPDIYLDRDSKGVLRVFENKGNEMEYNRGGIHHGDLLLGERVQSGNTEPGDILIAVGNEEMLVRRLNKKKKDALILSTFDPHTKDTTISTPDIREIWKVTGIFSRHLHTPGFLDKKVMSMERDIELLKSSMNKLRGKN